MLQCCSVCETRSAGRMQTSTILNTRAAVSFFNPPRDIIQGLWGEARGTDVLLSERIGGGKTCVQPRFCSHSTASRINHPPPSSIYPSIHTSRLRPSPCSIAELAMALPRMSILTIDLGRSSSAPGASPPSSQPLAVLSHALSRAGLPSFAQGAAACTQSAGTTFRDGTLRHQP